MRCTFCGLDEMTIASDRRGRPYLSCEACSTRVFVRGGLRRVVMYSVVAEYLKSLDWESVRRVVALRVAAASAGAPADRAPQVAPATAPQPQHTPA